MGNGTHNLLIGGHESLKTSPMFFFKTKGNNLQAHKGRHQQVAGKAENAQPSGHLSSGQRVIATKAKDIINYTSAKGGGRDRPCVPRTEPDPQSNQSKDNDGGSQDNSNHENTTDGKEPGGLPGRPCTAWGRDRFMMSEEWQGGGKGLHPGESQIATSGWIVTR
jgi:hypothetical protein